MVRIEVGGHPMDFIVDTSAEHLVVTEQVAPPWERKPLSSGPQVLRPAGTSVILNDAD